MQSLKPIAMLLWPTSKRGEFSVEVDSARVCSLSSLWPMFWYKSLVIGEEGTRLLILEQSF